ncbi:ABC transporter substrate-binding protein [Streptomyces populi]
MPEGSYDDLLQEQGTALKELRASRGHPSYRDIGARVQMEKIRGSLPKATLTSAFSGKHVNRDTLMWLVRTLMSWDEHGRECDPPGHESPRLNEWRTRWNDIDQLKPPPKRNKDSPEPQPVLVVSPGFPDVAGAVSLIEMIDGLARARSGRSRLPVVRVVSGDGQIAVDFVKAYASRLSDAKVPHAVIDAALLSRIDPAGSDGFGKLLDQVAARLRKSPGGPAGVPVLRAYDLCRFVVKECAAEEDQGERPGGHPAGERGDGSQNSAANSGASRRLGWLWRDRRPWRHQLVDALTGREQLDDADRRGLLVEALLGDLRRAKKQSALRPWQRPQNGPFLLLVPLGPDEPDAARRKLASQLATEIAKCGRRVPAPLLVLAAGASAATPQSAISVPDAARKVRPGIRFARSAESLTVGLDGAKGSTALPVDRLRPAPVSRRLSGRNLVAAGAVAAVVLTTIYVSQPDPERCAGLNHVDTTTQVGIDRGGQGCWFTTAPEQKKIRDLQRGINAENRRAMSGGGSSYVTVVFLAPLTDNSGGDDGQITPSAVMQLEGAFDAQKYYNKTVAHQPGGVRVRMLVANTGFAFQHGPEVARQITELTRTDPHIVAVIGIAQSRQETVDAINLLPKDLPVVSAAATGDFLAYTKYQRYFPTQPDNRIMARAMVNHVLKARPKGVLVVYGDNDLYSMNLRSDLMGELAQQHINGSNVKSVVLREKHPEYRDGRKAAKAMCDTYKAGGAVLYAARGTQLPRLWDDMRTTTCGSPSNHKMPVLAADINTVIENPSIDAQTYPGAYEGVKLSYVAFSATGNSDEATGRDAFFTLAEAVGETGAHRSPTDFLKQLRKGVEVPESSIQNQVLTQSSQTFTVADWNRDMAGRDLWICDAPPKQGGKKECRTP